jgi:DedD protein
MRDMNEPISQNPSARTKFKQRIAGGAVLLIVLAIFLPFIFRHAHNLNVNLDSAGNSAPNAQTTTANSAAPSASTSTSTSTPASSAPAHTEPSAPAAQEGVASPAPAQAAVSTTPSSDQNGMTSAQNEAPPSAQSDSSVVLPPPQAGTIAAAPPASNETAAPADPTAPALTTHNDTLATTQKSPDAAVTKSAPAPGRWILQVGSFNNAQNAQQLTAQLRSRGFHAYMQRSGNQLVRVYVGPLSSLQQAQKVQVQVQSEFKVSVLMREVRN